MTEEQIKIKIQEGSEIRLKRKELKNNNLSTVSVDLQHNNIILSKNSNCYMNSHHALFILDKQEKIVDLYKLDYDDQIAIKVLIDTTLEFCNLNTFNNYAIIDKKILYESDFKKFRILHKNNLEYNNISYHIKILKNTYNKLKEASSLLRELFSKCYNDEKFDIHCYYNTFSPSSNIQFVVSLQFDNITIKNSIEESCYLGTFIVKLRGYLNNHGELILNESLRGSRITYSDLNLLNNYHHSHLPEQSKSYHASFCLGDNSFFRQFSDNNGDIVIKDDIDVESLIISIRNYLEWESLEGGPHHKIENSMRVPDKSKYDFNINSNRSNLFIESYNLKLNIQIYKILLKNINRLQPYFKLKKNEKEEWYFDVDFEFYVQECLWVINSKINLKNLLKDFQEYIHSFDKNSFTFYEHNIFIIDKSDNIKETLLNNFNSRIESALRNLPPFYFNKKIVPSYVNEFLLNNIELDNLTLSPNPYVLLKFSNFVKNKLNSNLENYVKQPN